MNSFMGMKCTLKVRFSSSERTYNNKLMPNSNETNANESKHRKMLEIVSTPSKMLISLHSFQSS